MKVLIATVLILLSVASAHAATYYVSTAGSDSVSCATAQTIGTPKQTINAGMLCLSAGDTLYIRGGTYAESVGSGVITVPSGTSWSVPITIAAYNAESVIVQPTSFVDGALYLEASGGSIEYLIFDGIIFDGNNIALNTIYLTNGVRYIRIQNSEAKNAVRQGILISAGGYCTPLPCQTFYEIINVASHDNGTQTNLDHGIYIGTTDNLIENSQFYNNYAYGIQLYTGETSKRANDNIIRGNLVSNNAVGGTSGGVTINDGDNNLIYNNIIYGNYVNGAMNFSYGSMSNTRAFNNTISNSAGTGIYISSENSGALIENNIIYLSSDPVVNNGSGTAFATNFCTNADTGCTFTGDPLFINPSGGNYELGTESPAIDTGTEIVLVTDDFAGVTRPQNGIYDIGAYEFEAAGDTTDPTISITAPTSSPTYATATDPITTIAGTADDDTGVDSISWANTTTAGSGSGTGCAGETSCTWSIATIDLAEGVNIIEVTAHDAAANTAVDTITVTLDTTGPTGVAITDPGEGDPLTGTYQISATAVDTPSGMGHVEFYEGANLLCDDVTGPEPWTCNWDTTAVADGAYSLTVKAYDALGNITTSAAVGVIVDNVLDLAYPGPVTGLGLTASGTPTYPGPVTGISLTASGTPTYPGPVTGLGLTASGTPTYPGAITGLSLP